MRSKSKNKKHKTNSLLTFLVNESEDKSAKILQDLGQKVYNKKDLEKKLALHYTNCTDKIELEKQLANIHPHKDWILRVLGEKKPNEVVENIKPIKKDLKISEEDIKKVSNLENRSCACGCQSNFDGSTNNPNTLNINNDKLIIFGIVTVVAMFGLIIIKTK